MDAEPPSSAISSPSGSGDAPGNVRKERGAIAAQACETCRKRKQKCDEIRPRCSTCQKFNLTCDYRTPLPTKKDKTLVEILDRLRVIEGKVDHISHQQTTTATSSSNPSPYDAAPTTILQRPVNQQAGSSNESVPTSASLRPSGAASPLQQYRYASAVHQMMAWPMIRQLLDQASPQGSELHGFFMDPDPPAAMLAQQAARQQPLSTDGLEGMTMEDRALIGLPLDAGGGAGGGGISLADLDWATMENLAKAYFDTFNLIYPIMDRQTFSGGLLASVISNGFDASVDTTLVFLVLALGVVALADAQNMPLGGFKTADDDNDDLTHRPPGVAFFNEARKRLGFSLTDVSLENVQVFALAGLYFESCSRHMDFWRMSISASVACRALVTSNPAELQSPRANLIRRLFWHCSIMETSLNLELELPLTGLEKLEEVVGLPDFDDILLDAFYPESQDSHFKEHFASQVALRRLTVHFHNTLRNVLGPTPPFSPLASPSSSAELEPIAVTVVDGFFAQLDTWRSMLPQPLRWSDARAAHFQAPMPQPAYYGQGAMYPPQPALLQAADIFTADLTLAPTHYPYATDVRIALLRTRFHYNKYLIYRPFLFKALHHSSSVGTDDARCVAECLKACLKWPLIMSPTCHRKRLVPSLFLWSQNLLGVLIILHLSRQVPILQTIRATFCPATFDIDAGETVNLSIAWLRDLKDVDPTASWCWDVASRLYRLDDG